MTFFNSIKTALCATVAALAISSAPQTAEAGAEPFLGEIILVGYNFCPRGYADANGRLLAINQYQALFSLYGTQFGGDGRTTFGLPDMRGRVAMGHGSGPGLTDRNVGQKFGTENTTLNVTNIPPHNHSVTVTSNALPTPGTSPTPAGQIPGISSVGAIYGTGAGVVPMAANANTVSEQTVGGGQPFNNIQPTAVLRYCVSLAGFFPSRN